MAMDDMLTQINQILNNPDQMKEISKLASSIGITPPELPQDAQHEIPESVTNAFRSVQKKDEKQQALVRALLPYLRPKHQKKLEQAIKLVQLTHWAGATMQANNNEPNSKEEPDDL